MRCCPRKFVAPLTVVVLKSVTGSLKVTRNLAVVVCVEAGWSEVMPTITVGGPIVSGMADELRLGTSAVWSWVAGRRSR